ncbi:MAG TPA: hypothetical protein VHI31_01615 [Actinomycetota bacterium]|nr:hypothetical protein [Actinomycetota bacterium]
MKNIESPIAPELTSKSERYGATGRLEASAYRRRVIQSLSVMGLFLSVAAIESWLLGWIAPGSSVLSAGLLTGLTLGLMATIYLTRLGLWNDFGFRRPDRWSDLLRFAPFLVVGLLPLTAGVKAAPLTLAGWVIAGPLIAFYKMVVLGGLLYAFKPLGRWRAAGLAALAFAVFEFGGVLGGGALLATGLLSLMYFFLSFAYGAAWLRTGLIWPLVIANALMTVSAASTQRSVEASNVANSAADMFSGIGVAVLLAAYGAFLLRGTRRNPH